MTKRLWIIVFCSFFLVNIANGYELNSEEKDKIIKTTNRLEDVIKNKGEKHRENYVDAIDQLIKTYKNNEKLTTLLKTLKDNISDSTKKEIQDKILKELNNDGFPDFKFLYSEEAIKNMPFLFDRLVKEKEQAFDELLKTKDEDINFDLIQKFNNDDNLTYLFAIIEEYECVNGTDFITEVVNDAQAKISDLTNKIGYSKDFYNIYKKVQEKGGLDSDQKRIIDRTISNFELEGISLSDDKLGNIKEINKELAELSSKFGQNLLNSQRDYRYYVDDLEKIKELPEDTLETAHNDALEEGKEGYLFNYNTAGYLINYSSDSDIRKAVRDDNKNFAYTGEDDNREVILKILKLRQQKAKLLGYKDYGEYSLSNKMAPSPEFVIKQEDEILVKAKEKAQKEIDEIKEYFKLEELNPWDYGYYSRILQEEKYQYDSDAMRDYFEFERVKKGLFDIAEKLYGLKFVEIKDEMYGEDVNAYEVYKDGELKGYYLQDYFYNPNKASGAWANVIRTKNKTFSENKLPVVVNILNISKGKDKTLLTYYDVTTMFHEFGHAIHGLLSKSDYPELGGFSIEWDFAELPSQLMENWAKGEGLKTFAYNYKTGEQISDEQIQKMQTLDTFSTGIWTAIGIMYSRIDMALHTTQEINSVEDLDKITYDVVDGVGPFKDDKNNHMYTSFSHIFDGGYSAGYYSYMWAEIIEADIFSKFKENGIFDKETADQFYNTILSQGSRKPALELFKDFMGRDIELNGFYEKKGFNN